MNTTEGRNSITKDEVSRHVCHSNEDRESVLFIGTQFSNLYTSVDTPARGSVGFTVVANQRVSIVSDE